MVYNWDDKEADCYRLYVEEKQSLDQVIAFWASRNFTPSKRAFQTQFKRWDFPGKQNPAHKNATLVARLRELWEQNCSQRDMVDTLQSEGFPINDRELIRLRLRLKLLLRESVRRPKKKQPLQDGVRKKRAKKKKQVKMVAGKGLINQLANAILAEQSSSESESGEDLEATQYDSEQNSQDIQSLILEPESSLLSTEDVLRKQLRKEQLQLESDEKWRTRKRRRRTRGWAGLPADAPGEPPRFPSETTIDEAKAFLELDNDMYRLLREHFLDICKEHGVVKKTVSGPEKWSQVVQLLIRGNQHLSNVFKDEPEVFQDKDAVFRPKGQKALSLDVICMDVTKRLRTMETRMTLPDAKNALGLNPEQTRQARSAFAAKLKADHFTNKHEAGELHWTALKQAWVNESDLLRKTLGEGEVDPEYARKLKAIEVLARDVMKRQQQEKTAKDSTKKKQLHQGPGPGPAPPVVSPHQPILQNTNRQTIPTRRGNMLQTSCITIPPAPASSDLQIDPSLLLAASDAAILPSTEYQVEPHLSPRQELYQQPYYSTSPSLQSILLPVYFRLHPSSTASFPSKSVWLSILQTSSIVELRNLAVREHPGTVVSKLEGLVVYRAGQQESEVVVEIGDDEELGAYLSHVRGDDQGQGHSAGKATFVVTLDVSDAAAIVAMETSKVGGQYG